MSLALQTRAELLPRVVEHLVDGAARRAQLCRDDVDLNAVERDRDEDLALAGRQLLGHRAAERAEQLGRLDAGLGRGRPTGQSVPRGVVVGSRDASSPPGVPTELHRHLEHGKAVGPGREAARAPKAVELAGHGNHRVVGGLPTEVVELGARDLRVQVPAASRLGVGGSKQKVVQSLERRAAAGPRRTQSVEPRA